MKQDVEKLIGEFKSDGRDMVVKKNSEILLQVVLTLIYPIWLFLSRTQVRGILCICSSAALLSIIFFTLTPGLANNIGGQAQSIGTGLVILGLMCAPFVGVLLIVIGSFLKTMYEKYKY